MICKYCNTKMTDNSYRNFDRTVSLFFRCDKCQSIYYKRDEEKWYTKQEYENHVNKEGLK